VLGFCCVLDEVDAILRQLSADQDRLLISEFCKPRLYSPAEAVSGTKYNPAVTWFNLSDAAHKMVVRLSHWKDSVVFRQIWKAQLKRVASSGNKLTVDQIEQSIWQQAKNIWEAFGRGMVSMLWSCVYIYIYIYIYTRYTNKK